MIVSSVATLADLLTGNVERRNHGDEKRINERRKSNWMAFMKPRLRTRRPNYF